MEDQDLIVLALTGRTDAFGDLVTRYQDRLYRSLLMVTGRAEDAEDVVQEAFVQAFQKLSTFHGRSQFYTWIYRIAMNCWISRRRKKSERMVVQPLHAAVLVQPENRQEGPAQHLLRTEQAGQVRAAMAQLAEEHRAILVLREFDQCDYETISQVLDLPVGTVRSRIHRARIQLKALLEQVIHDP